MYDALTFIHLRIIW